MKTIRYKLSRANNPAKPIATLTFRGRSKKEALENAQSFSERHNVAMGFTDASGFHPIRASEDYSRKRAGEKPRRKFSRAKSRTRKSRPMH